MHELKETHITSFRFQPPSQLWPYLSPLMDVIPNRGTTKVHMEVSIAASNTHQTVPDPKKAVALVHWQEKEDFSHHNATLSPCVLHSLYFPPNKLPVGERNAISSYHIIRRYFCFYVIMGYGTLTYTLPFGTKVYSLNDSPFWSLGTQSKVPKGGTISCYHFGVPQHTEENAG